MLEILIRAGCFVAIIVLGFVLRRTGFFNEHTFGILSKIVIKITLPCAILYNLSSVSIDPSMMLLALLGFGGGVLYMLVAFVINLRSTKEKRAFEVLNFSGYNIGNFTMPFVQSFLGPMGVVTTSLFDLGNAVVCLGGAFSVASMIKEGGKLSVKRIFKTLFTSLPFLSYVFGTFMLLTKLPWPTPLVSFTGIVGNSNAFLAMLMIGVGFKLQANRTQIGTIVKAVVIRYGIAALLAVCFYFVLPFELQIRQALVLVAFSPIASAVPAFTGEMKSDVGLSSAINSISIVCSIVIIVSLLMVLL